MCEAEASTDSVISDDETAFSRGRTATRPASHRRRRSFCCLVPDAWERLPRGAPSSLEASRVLSRNLTAARCTSEKSVPQQPQLSASCTAGRACVVATAAWRSLSRSCPRILAAGGDWSTTEETTHVDPDDLRRLAGRRPGDVTLGGRPTGHSTGDLGVRVPALEQLKLSGSNVATVRDLGLLRNVQVLWLARSGVHDLEGISAAGAARVLRRVQQRLRPLAADGRRAPPGARPRGQRDRRPGEYLAFCEELQSLTLLDNAVADAADFRAQVAAAPPRLELLDDEPLPRWSGGADERGGAAGAAAAAEASAASAALGAAAAGAAPPLPQCAPTGRPSTAPARRRGGRERRGGRPTPTRGAAARLR